MPVVRRMGKERRAGDLTASEVEMLAAPFSLWREPFREMSEAEIARLYQGHRETIIAQYQRWHPGLWPEIAWKYDAGVPEDLRALPAYDPRMIWLLESDDLDEWRAHTEPTTRVQEARAQWLLRQRFFGAR